MKTSKKLHRQASFYIITLIFTLEHPFIAICGSVDTFKINQLKLMKAFELIEQKMKFRSKNS